MNELQKEYFERVQKEQAEVEAAEEARLKAVMEAERKKDAANKEAERRAAEEADKKAEAEAIEIINRVKAEMAANKKKEAEAAKNAEKDAEKAADKDTPKKEAEGKQPEANEEAAEEELNIYEREPVGEASMPKKSPKFKKGGKKTTAAKVPQRPQQETAAASDIEAQPEEIKEEVPDMKQNTKQEAKPKKPKETGAEKKQAADSEPAKEAETKATEAKEETKKEQPEEAQSADEATEETVEKATPESVAASQREAKLQELAEEYQDKYKRLLAEFENARAREAKEASKMYDVGAKAVLEKLLPVVDNFERAIQTIPEEDKNRAFEQGVDKIYKQMMTILGDIGVEPMNAEGTEFNPDLHNAVMHVEDEELGENVVAEEMQKGYMYKDSVLRYSMVKVAN